MTFFTQAIDALGAACAWEARDVSNAPPQLPRQRRSSTAGDLPGGRPSGAQLCGSGEDFELAQREAQTLICFIVHIKKNYALYASGPDT